jgi:hypothetical protein
MSKGDFLMLQLAAISGPLVLRRRLSPVLLIELFVEVCRLEDEVEKGDPPAPQTD